MKSSSGYSSEARYKVHRPWLRVLLVLQERPDIGCVGFGAVFLWFFKRGPT